MIWDVLALIRDALKGMFIILIMFASISIVQGALWMLVWNYGICTIFAGIPKFTFASSCLVMFGVNVLGWAFYGRSGTGGEDV